jgi:hypothetical protein
MKRLFLSKTVRRLLPGFARKNESGQAVILLALGFVALLAFVGIVTDVSLMFVRYSTLSRAVDAAAIAAAGQMRSDRTFGEVGLAARQFIEFHGLDPLDVLVETCETSPNDPGLCPLDQRKLVRVTATIISPTIFMRLLGFGNIELTAVAVSETAVLDVVIMMDVSESMLFDTTYEDWARIGYGKVYVPPRMGGRSSTLLEDTNGNKVWDAGDALTIYPGELDENKTVFGRELKDQVAGTDPNDGDQLWFPATPSYPPCNPQPCTPSHEPYFESLFDFWDDMVIENTQQTISERLQYSAGDNAPTADKDYGVQTFDYVGVGGTAFGAQQQPRSLCRVRFWPYSRRVPLRQDVLDLYSRLGVTWEDPKKQWDGFVPTYDFYGCCNDPTVNGQIDEDYNLTSMNGSPIAANNGAGNGDFRFNDLICQPFKQARDATRQFLERIDFTRGDRVAFVTFDKTAFLIDPDGANGATANPECATVENPPNTTTGRTELTHMIETECRAKLTLDTYLGVRAEPNSYVWKDDGGGWSAYADGIDDEGASKKINYFEKRLIVPENEWGNNGNGNVPLNTYPVRDHCPLQNGTLPQLASRYSLWTRGDFNQYGSALPGLVRIMMPSTQAGPWVGTGIDERNSYELWASCRNTNIGAALRTGSSALLDPNTTRRTGTVWVMVLLGDGAAGGSDPVRQNGYKLRDGSFTNSDGIYTEPSVYADQGSVKSTWENWAGFTDNIRYGTNDDTRRAQYGAFGLCPFGVPTATGRSSLTRIYPSLTDVARFPFCSDEDPESRHFSMPPQQAQTVQAQVGGSCEATTGPTYQPGFRPGAKDREYQCTVPAGEDQLQYNLDNGNVYDVDIGVWDYFGQKVGTNNFDPMYDVDDYARDWADYIALSEGSADEQLPTIFTIGFGLNFEIGTSTPGLDPSDPGYVPGTAAQNVPDYLGEELLRYIADVGDNFQIDTDYQQDWRDDGLSNNSVTDYGVLGPCEQQWALSGTTPTPASAYRPLGPRTSCGNYYNAPNREQLELVFDDIASRMFTRLTG